MIRGVTLREYGEGRASPAVPARASLAGPLGLILLLRRP